ncbi:IclR family transcriptional regulator [Mycobacterium sp. 1482292.6]|uniref:IclR family transcriptional regulator n=1 Tax=Mycobacterium sp. 1482292.6 TaxID=1834081 RepID=UPI0007FD790C|nr:IclR family transcriptional regulator [Mycobacterium sp. 1482292.6]OBJ12644.1 IclR family transcriptional regulator [Mycobacterium sp. 1482292.6]
MSEADDLDIPPRTPSSRPLSAGIKPLLVLAKIRGIMDAFTLSEPELTLSEIRARTGYPTSTVQRLVANLVAEEFLDRIGDRFRIGARVAYWAAPVASSMGLLEAVSPALESLRDASGETACFFRREGPFRVCVAIAETRHGIRREMHVGKIVPLHVGSAGRVLMAWDDDALREVLASDLARFTDATVTDPDVLRANVEEARRMGFAITSGERDEGATGVAAPVFDARGQVLGALMISGPSFRFSPELAERWADNVVGAADQVTRTLGGRLPY